MTQSTISAAQDILDQLQSLEATSSTTPADLVESAAEWTETIDKKRVFLENRSHPIVFMGSVGVGKSALIAVAANLLTSPSPADRTSLKNTSVLAIGSGRTTVCEVDIRASDDVAELALRIEPFSIVEMEEEIKIYAEEEWRRLQPNSKRGDEDDSNPTPQEVQRVIRGMTDYVERQVTRIENLFRRRMVVRPLEEAALSFDSAEKFYIHLLERAKLSVRETTEWKWSTCTAETLKELKICFESVNQGTEPTAMLPKKMTVLVPNPLPGSTTGLDLTLVDTRGLDGIVESRRDLQDFLRDPRAIIVLCATFKDAPGDAIRSLLRSMAGDAELRQAIPRTMLLMLDHGDADQVNGSEGDRDYGQDLKINECFAALDSTGMRMIEREQIFAFDVLKDDRNRLLTTIDDCIERVRNAIENELIEDIGHAKGFIGNSADVLRPARREYVDRQLREAMAHHLPSDSPLRDPLTGLYEAITRSRYASVVYATCRRRGLYSGLNLYAAIEAEASRAATMWLDDLVSAATKKLNELEQDTSAVIVLDHISLRKMQYREAQIKVTRGYAERVVSEVVKLLQPDGVWETCRSEWGAGDGFKNKVLNHLSSWSSKQLGLTAHEHTDATTEIPLLGEISRPAQPPRFSLHVRNLRALSQVDWSPEPISVLIGANGTGKTSLLLVLKLLRISYERGLSEAVVAVLRGSGNLRSWGATETDPVEIGLDIGNASWRIQLIPRAGSVDYITNERLLDQGREIFSRDSLGAFQYGAERIEPSTHLGLRTLIDKGVLDHSLRTVTAFLQNIAVFHDPDIWSLRENGSNTSERGLLQSRGANVLSVLRRWSQEKNNRHRYQFVLEGLSAAFPHAVGDIDFIEAGNTLVAQVYAPGSQIPKPLAGEANGLLQLLVLFCDVASVEDESVIAIDEPENSLHPYAVRVFLKRTSRWARQHNITVLLATHSTVLLDELSATPEQVFVMKPGDKEISFPARLDQLYDRQWLEDFKLGDLYEQGEIGSNDDES